MKAKGLAVAILVVLVVLVVVLLAYFVFSGDSGEGDSKEEIRGGRSRRGGRGRRGRRGGRGRRGRGGGRRYGGGPWQPYGLGGWPWRGYLDAGWYGYPAYYPTYLRDYGNIRPCVGDPTGGRPLCSGPEGAWGVEDRCRAPGLSGDAEYVWREGPEEGQKCYSFNP